MADMLKYNTTITECYLRGSHFDDKAADIIADIIRVSSHWSCNLKFVYHNTPAWVL